MSKTPYRVKCGRTSRTPSCPPGNVFRKSAGFDGGKPRLYGIPCRSIHRYLYVGMHLRDNLITRFIFSSTSTIFLCSNLLGRVDKAQDLLALPWTNVNAQYANGNTPLILAVQGI